MAEHTTRAETPEVTRVPEADDLRESGGEAAREKRLSSVATAIALLKAFSEDEVDIGVSTLAAHSCDLADQLMRGLAELPNAPVLGRSARERVALATVSLDVPSMRQQDIARLLADAHRIFVSGGFHCAHVLHHRLKLEGTIRVSAQIYNDASDIEAVLEALREL